ncbi:MAG: hypothetical protein F9K41_10545 [Sphingopyxis terrae]|nr:MAG: hypothetical protein F9K41_10545 [Sphingopyxis terrae]
MTGDRIIHSTIDDLPAALAPYAGSRRVEVRIIDATDEEERDNVRRVIEARDRDPRPDVPADEVYDRALAKIDKIRKAKQDASQ